MPGKRDKLLITFALSGYNHERFIQEAIRGAFGQTYSPLEIILSDDCSNDRTFAIMREMAKGYRGPHSIILNRNDRNLGMIAHVNRIMEIARGDLVVAAASDDVSLPERVERIYRAYELSDRCAKSIFSNAIIINTEGKPHEMEFSTPMKAEEFLPEILVRKDSILSGCTHAWSREVFDVFGPLLAHGKCEDVVIPFRSALLGRIEYIHEPLVMYRWHDSNVSRRWKEPVNFIYERKAIYENWLKDLEKMKTLFSERDAEIEHLRNIVLKRLHSVENDICINDADWGKKVKMIVKQMLEGEDLRIIRHKIGIFLMPRIYRKYMSLKSGMNSKGKK